MWRRWSATRLTAVEMSPDKRLVLAYDAAQLRLSLQDSTLSNTRTRANYLLATSALAVSFSAGIGFVNLDPSKGVTFPMTAAALILITVVALGTCVVYVMVPAKGWCYNPSATVILEKIGDGLDENAIRRLVTRAMIDGAEANHTMLVKKQKAFRGAIVLLVIEVVLLIGTLAAQMEVAQ